MSRQINLFNPVLLKQEKYVSARTMVQALGLIVVSCVAISGFVAYSVASVRAEAEGAAARVAAEQAKLTKLATEIKAPQKDKAVGEAVKGAEAEVTALRQVSDVLGRGEMGNTQGYSEYLRAFARQIVPGVWLTGFIIHGAGNEIALFGRALQPDLVPMYVSRLKNEPVMQGKSFATLEMSPPEMLATNATAGPAAKGDDAKIQEAARPGYIEFALKSSGFAIPEKAR